MQPQQVQQVQQPQVLEAMYYGNGIAVYGPTQPWKEDLKTLGGKYNSNLGGQPGWIFGKGREQALMQFIGSANAGAIQPTPSQVAPRSPYRQQAFGQQQFQAQAIAPVAAPQLLRQDGPLPVIQPIRQAPAQPTRPKLTVTNFQDVGLAGVVPLQFRGDDGLEYQLQWYSVPVPHEGQRVRIDYSIGAVPNPPQATYVVSYVGMTPINNFEITVQESGEKLPVDLVRGEWQLRTAPSHTITLLPDQPQPTVVQQ